MTYNISDTVSNSHGELIEYPDEFDFETADIDKVNKTISKELSEYDAKFRNTLLEELHGVNCLCPEETPEMVAQALVDLDNEIEYRIPPSAKQSYLRAQKNPNSYIHTKEFRMKFLRCSLFEIPLVARKLVEFLNLAEELFGEQLLHRGVCLSDFSKKEIKLLRLGRFQFMPFGDCTGRRIIVLIYDEIWEGFSAEQKAKISLYVFWTVDDPLVQRRGIVIIVWFDKEFKITQMPKNTDYRFRDHKLATCRVSCIHFAAPDTNFYRLRVAICTMRLGRTRRHVKSHFGDSTETRYSLQVYGIPIDQLPISHNGKVKLGYARQWVNVRSQIENNCHPERFESIGLRSSEVIIEYPRPFDVVFRQGSSCNSHPANREFRGLIRQKVCEQEESLNLVGKAKIRRKKIVMDIVSETQIKHGGRFLIWNEIGGWNELHDEDLINAKIEYLIKEFRKSVRNKKSSKQIVLQTDTSMFRSNFDVETGLLQQFSPFDFNQAVDDMELLEAVSCIKNCFAAS